MRTVIHGRGQRLLPAIGTLLRLYWNGLEGAGGISVDGEGWASAGASQRQVSVTGHGIGHRDRPGVQPVSHGLPELLACFPCSWFSWEAGAVDSVPGQHDLPQLGPSSHAWIMWCGPVGPWGRAGHQEQLAVGSGLGGKSSLWPRPRCVRAG